MFKNLNVFSTWYVCNFSALFQESLAISTSSFTASRRMSLESALVEAWQILPATGEEGGSGVIGYHWMSSVFHGFPDVNVSRVLYRHSFFACEMEVLYYTDFNLFQLYCIWFLESFLFGTEDRSILVLYRGSIRTVVPICIHIRITSSCFAL